MGREIDESNWTKALRETDQSEAERKKSMTDAKEKAEKERELSIKILQNEEVKSREKAA